MARHSIPFFSILIISWIQRKIKDVRKQLVLYRKKSLLRKTLTSVILLSIQLNIIQTDFQSLSLSMWISILRILTFSALIAFDLCMLHSAWKRLIGCRS